MESLDIPPSALDAALNYARHGWRVIPVKGKAPYLKNWPQKASNQESDIYRLFNRDSLNIGIVTGQGSGIVCLDLDPRNGSELSLKRMEQQFGKLPETVRAATGGGGEHRIFKYAPGMKSQTPEDGIDFLASGKIFVAAPSIHPTTGALYEWMIGPDELQPAALPTAWVEALSHDSKPARKPQEADTGDIHKGGRNIALTSIAGKQKAQGVNKSACLTYLLEENARRCKPPLSWSEVETIVASVYSYEKSAASLKTIWQMQVMSDPAMNATQKSVLYTLSFFADANGRSCYPTQEQIAAGAGCTRPTAQKYLKASEGVWFETYKRGRDGHGFNYGYRLLPKDA